MSTAALVFWVLLACSSWNGHTLSCTDFGYYFPSRETCEQAKTSATIGSTGVLVCVPDEDPKWKRER